MLAFADWRFRHGGARDQAIKDLFGMSAVRFDQQINALLDNPDALPHAPQTVARLRRIREQNRQRRSVRLTAR